MDVPGQHFGFKIGAAGPLPTVFVGARAYMAGRFYLYGGYAQIMDIPTVGGGIGWDIALPGLPVRVQPQVGYTNAIDFLQWPGGSLSLVFARHHSSEYKYDRQQGL